MATGGSPSKGSSSDSHARSGWQSTSDDAVSMNSIQNELRPNNLEVSEWKESTLESNKRRKKGNRERERERGQSLLQDLPSPTERRQHTPSSYSRTKLPPNTELSERMELENLKQHFSFDDYEVSSDEEKNNEKTVTFNRRDMPPNYTHQDTSSTTSEHHRHSDTESRKNQKTIKKNKNRVGDARYQSEENEEKEKNDEKRGAKNNVLQDRTQEAITDSNQIVARMMQIKDYRKQIKLMMDTLQESDDPTDHRKISKLAQVLSSLEEQEKSYMEILQKLWIIRKRALLNGNSNPNETSKGESPDDTDSVDSQTSDTALHNFESALAEKSEDLTSLGQQQILLKQIMEQKEQLKQLQERQSALLAIEKDAVHKLAEARERQKLLEEPTMDNTAAPEFVLYQRDNQPAENTIEDDIEECRKMQNNLPLSNPQSEDNLITVNLENLAFDTSDFQERICQGRLSLQNKLKHLQDKRKCVNELLRYVKSLRAQSTDEMSQMNNNPENIENSVQNSETEKTDSPEDDLNFPEPNEKWEELLGVRERLNHLRSLFKEYRVCANDVDEATEAKDLISTEEGEKTQNSQQIKSSSCEASDKYSESNHIQNMSDFEEDFNTELGSLISQPGVRDKLNELKEAKDRLRHLQKLIDKLNDSSEGTPEQTAEELAEILAQTDNQTISKTISRSSGLSEASASASGAAFTQVSNDQLIPLQNKSVKLKMKMQEQQLEVDRLKEQRERLLSFHRQLLNFHDSLPGWNDEIEKSDRDKTNEVTFAPEPEIQDLNQMTYSSNDELYNKMRKERIQREELRQRKKEMEDLMHKDKPKRNYSRNQDNQSDSVSYSTDFLGANTSADVTMATWGGSTADNFENINEGCDRDDDEEGDDEEGEDINEEFNEDDDYLSDMLRDAEEGGESSSKETYTIEKDARRHIVKQSQPSLLGCMPLDSRGSFPAGKRNKYCCQRTDFKGNPPNQKQFDRTNSGFARKQENIRAAEYIIQEDEHDESLQSESSPLNLLERQMDKMTNTYQELLTEQQQLRHQLHMMRYQNSSGFAFDANQPANMYWQSNPLLTPPEVQNSASQQQILLALSQCFQQLSVQQSEMNNLQRQLHTLVLQSSKKTDSSTSSNSYFQNSFATGVNQWKKPKHFCWEPYPQNSYLCGNRFSNSLLKPDAIQKTKMKSNNMLSSTVPTIKSRKRTNSSDKNFRRRYLNKQYCDKENAEKCPQGCSQTCSYFWNFSNTNKDTAVDVPGKSKKLSASSRQKHTANLSSKNMTPEDGKRKLKSSQNTALEFKHEATNACAKFYHKPTSNSTNSKKAKNENSLWSNKTTADLMNQCESEATKKENISDQLDSNTFDSLKSDIYAEVAKLISQNEKHPKYMISLFQKLQCFDSNNKREHIMNIIDALLEHARLRESVYSSKFDEFPYPSLTSNRIPSISDNAKIEATLKKKTHDSSSDDDSGSEAIDLSDLHFAKDSLDETAINLKKVLCQVTKQQKTECREKLLNRELCHSSHTAVDQGSESSVSDMVVIKSDNQSVSEIIKEISKQLMPIINLHKDETFSELLISDIQQKIVVLLHQSFSEQDINFKHFNSNLYNNLIEFKNQTVADCYHAMLKKISDVLYNELSYLRLMEDLSENTLSKSLLEKLALFNQDTNDTSILDQLTIDYDTTLAASGTQLLADGDLTTRGSLLSCHKKLSDNVEIDVKDNNRYENAEEIPNGFLSGSSKSSQDQGVPMEIELAVSETKPFSKIGSDEDDEDDDESHNAEDPSITAVSLAVEKENHCFPERGDGDIPSKVKFSDSEIPRKPNGLVPKSSNDTNQSPPSNQLEEFISPANDQLQVEDIPNALQSLSNDQLEEATNDQLIPGAAFFDNLEKKNELAGDSEALPCNKLNTHFDAASDP